MNRALNTDLDKDLYKFGIDWVNGVLPLTDVKEFFNVLKSFSSKLDISRWEVASTGRYNYRTRLMLNGKASFQIMYNPLSDMQVNSIHDVDYALDDSKSNNPYIFISISGDGIRYLMSLGKENFNAFFKLITYLYSNGFKCSRLDTYCDILDKNNKVVPLLKKAFTYFLNPRVSYPTITTNFQRSRKNLTINRSSDDEGKTFYNITLGSHGSSGGMFRCYNKLVEVVDGRLSGFAPYILEKYCQTGYWYRLEYELHKEKAAAMFNVALQDACENGTFSVNSIFASVASEMFTPVTMTGVGIRKVATLPAIDIWDAFLSLVSTKLFILSMSSVPYVPTDRRRLRNNMDRLKTYFYAMLLEFDSWSEFHQREFLEDCRACFDSKKKYNEFRDELSETVKGYSSDRLPIIA